ncbi:hypothetical protein D3C71_1382910 [compost metagenome]
MRCVRSKRRKGLPASTWRASLPGADAGAITTSCSSYSGVQRVLAILRPASTRKAASSSPSSTLPASSLALPDRMRTSSLGWAFFSPDTTLDSVPMHDTMLPTDTAPANSPGTVLGRRIRSYKSSKCLISGSNSRPAALRMASRPLRSNSSRPSSASNDRIWKLTAAWVSATCSAASEKEPWWATARKVRKNRMVLIAVTHKNFFYDGTKNQIDLIRSREYLRLLNRSDRLETST